jgi:hypothetical protein
MNHIHDASRNFHCTPSNEHEFKFSNHGKLHASSLKEVESMLPIIAGPIKTQSNRMMASMIVYNNDNGRVGSIRLIPAEVPSGMINEVHQGKYKWSKAVKEHVHNEELAAIKSALSLKKICIESQLNELNNRNLGLMLKKFHMLFGVKSMDA